jgi:HEAT repeat protein
MAVQQAELGTATVESLLTELTRTEAGAREALGETALYLKFKALVYLHPEASARLGKRLAAAAADGLAMRVLPQALANSGRPEAQAALAAVVRGRPDDWPALAELLPALGMAKAPTRVVEAALFELASAGREEIRSTAQLALGSLARGLGGSAPTRADAIVRWAIAQLEGARSTGQRRQILLVLGNAGSPRALPAIRPWLNAPQPEVRGGAILALRWLKGPEIDGKLCKGLTDDDASVRLEAARALQVRPVTAAMLAVYAAALRKEGAAGVRVALLENLALARRTFPEAAELIKQASEKDPVAQVREAAATLLDES